MTPLPDPYSKGGEPRTRYRPPLSDIKERDAQTEPVPGRALPLGMAGTKYDHARRPASTYHLDSPDVAMGDRHVLLDMLREATRPNPDPLDVQIAPLPPPNLSLMGPSPLRRSVVIPLVLASVVGVGLFGLWVAVKW